MVLLDGLTFDDVLLVPQYSTIPSRTEVDISTALGGMTLKVPIISANMDTITDHVMANCMANNGGLGILHRYVSPVTVLQWLSFLKNLAVPPVPSIGVSNADMDNAALYRPFTDSICVDVAHGDSLMMSLRLEKLKKDFNYKNIIAGNVATGEAAKRLFQSGANIIKVGVGPGSVCTTRIVTGHGVPQLTAISDVHKAVGEEAYIIADGGIRSSGDIVKALAAGADAVMIGGLFAGCNETPNVDGVYRGMASKEAQLSFKGKVSNSTAEGVAINAPPKGKVSDVLESLAGGIRSGLSYSGCKTIKDLQEYAIFMRITPNGLAESHPHGLNKK